MSERKKRHYWHVSIRDAQESVLFPLDLYKFIDNLNYSMDTEIVNIVPLEYKGKKVIAIIYKEEVMQEEHIEMVKEYENPRGEFKGSLEEIRFF